MPTYEYKCANGHHEEHFRAFNDPEPVEMVCQQCQESLKKVFSSPSINLVGRGFYRNGG